MERGYKEFSVHQLETDKPKKRCRKWNLVTCDGSRYKNGALRKNRTYFEGTYTEAMAEAKRLAGKRKNRISDESWDFESYAMHWNDTRLALGLIEKSTHCGNRSLILCMSRHIGNVRMDELSHRHIEQAYVSMRNGDNVRGKPLRGTSMRGIHSVCKMACGHAVKEGILERNPFDDVERPKMDTREKSALRMSEEVELSMMLDSTDRHHVAIVLMMECGLRRGEVCGLRWGDIRDGMVFVNRSMKYDGSLGKVKGGRSRIVPLSASARDTLKKYRKSQEVALASRFMLLDDDIHIMANEFGDAMLPNSLSKWWANNRDSLGLEGFTLHQFRHTFCTNMAEAGIHPKIMQQLMGHATERITMQVYSHVHDEQLSDAIAAMDCARASM